MSINNRNILTLTIDSNCINARGNYKYMNKVEELVKKGRVKIYVTSTMETEFLKDKGYQKGINKLRNYEVDIEIGVWSHSRFGSCKFGSKEDSKRFNEIKKILFPNLKELTDEQIKDSMHLQTHLHYNRDFFITDDKKHILNKKDELKERLKLLVCTPKEFCENIINGSEE